MFLAGLGLTLAMAAVSSAGRAQSKVLACPIMPSFDVVWSGVTCP
jgi:hypothetical protein